MLDEVLMRIKLATPLLGEFPRYADVKLPDNFLSRLCGGEQGKIELLLFNDFLSRLCGGEPMPV